jgi:hypothetical protein
MKNQEIHDKNSVTVFATACYRALAKSVENKSKLESQVNKYCVQY